MKNICKNISGALLVTVCCLYGCTNEDYPLYDTGQKDSVFFEYLNDKEELATEIDYAFNFDIADSHTVEIPVTLMGMPVNRDRQILLQPVDEETDMLEDKHYVIESSVLPANEVKTLVKVKLLRNNDPELRERVFKLTLALQENEDLRATGQNKFTITYSDIRPDIRPEWWTATAPMPVYSYEAGQMFFEYFYRLAPEANINVFNDMIGEYGDYFVKAVQLRGPFAMYDVFLKRYVLMKMYKEHKDDFEWQSIPAL